MSVTFILRPGLNTGPGRPSPAAKSILDGTSPPKRNPAILRTDPNQLHFCLQKAPKSIQGVVGTSHNTHCAAYHRKPEKQVKHWGP
ncbi:unnamed protein product [Bursaphelenchus xylophilus]|uniref:(pine wood nematode) hypothetical protein n=1 Tax=Bursaphelenchus xylophilus TaxID=6326 RepID=A0A7I8XJA2_BURXY|nr:unnamed protein product [Bursaphelenchus xylophilus]CAG9121157.1 unnamed protein product [Bursaphelenchus xylophilus]